MTTLAGTPFEWLEFDPTGALVDPGAGARLAKLLGPGVTDIVVISHGWKTDHAGALALYEPLWQNVRSGWKPGARDIGGFVVAGVQWPSLMFRTDFDNPVSDAGGIASLGPTSGDDGDLDRTAFLTLLSDFRDATGPAADPVRQAALDAEDGFSPQQAEALLQALHAAVSPVNGDPELAGIRAPLDGDAQDLLLNLTKAPILTLDPAAGQAMGLGAVINGVLEGPRAAIARLLNQFTYFEMKARAGTVGAALGANVLAALAPASGVRLHLVGHSFGGRLVASAAAHVPKMAVLPLTSLTLLQAAFSHNALSPAFGDGLVGAFPKIVGSVVGPISATHTHNDSACTIAYALASRLSRDNAQSIGDANDQFGAIGANGILNLPPGATQQVSAMSPTANYVFAAGKVHNFNADACVSEHMDVTNAAVGRLLAAALAG